MKTLKILFSIIFFSTLTSCENKHSIKTVGIDKIDTSGIYFSYEHLGQDYFGKFELNDISEDFNTSDSLQIKIEILNPEKIEFGKVIKRIWVSEETIIPLQIEKQTGKIYNYHSVDRKPIFPGASNEFENDSAIFEFIRHNFNLPKNSKKMEFYIFIDGSGEVTLNKAFYSAKEDLKFIDLVIQLLPTFATNS